MRPAVLCLVLCACTSSSSSSRSDAATDAYVPVGDASQICTPGAFVFCRCADNSEGTKVCQPDGVSFSACTPCPGDKDASAD